jgi:molybdopterin synthase catalytic subunit
MFAISDSGIAVDGLREQLMDPGAGGLCVFEGWVRNENEGRTVERLEYEVYEPLAISEGEKVIAEAKELYPHLQACCVHRSGLLEIGDCAVWVGVAAPHRDEAFKACRYIIDQIKVKLPIWKKEHYIDGDSGWVNCERCANV